MKLGLLCRFEVAIYLIIYMLYLGIGMYEIYALRDRIANDAQFGFTQGWPFLDRPRNIISHEYKDFAEFMIIYWPYFIIHVVVSSITKWKCPQLQQHGHVAVSAIALLLTLHWASLSIIGTLLASYYLAAKCHSKPLTWLLTIAWLMFMELPKTWLTTYTSGSEFITVIVTFGFSLLRGVSYSLSKSDSRNLVDFLGYMLYFPSLTSGPIISYERYSARRESKGWLCLLQSLLRCVFWWMVVQFVFHYIYIYQMTQDVEVVSWMSSPLWCYTIAYFLGKFFNIFYMIIYGMGKAFAEHDGIPAPPNPRCIGRIHFYSNMWKHFDSGLYEFLFKHIYKEVCNKDSSILVKVWGTTLTFAFVYVWHGSYVNVFIWSALNCLCILAEKFYKIMISTAAYQQWMHRHLGIGGTQRFNALLATQIFIPAAFSNMYFIASPELADVLLRCAYLNGVGNYLALTFSIYCFFQCSVIVEESMKHPQLKDKRT